MSILTRQELLKYKQQVDEAMLKDLKSWHDLGAWEMADRSTAQNLIDSRWVIKWKLIDGLKAVKARLCVRGFKDRQADWLETHASTASRWGQRVVCQVVAQMKWKLFSFDVSAAFLKGMTFEEVHKLQAEMEKQGIDSEPMSGESEPKGSRPMRVVHLDLPKECLHLVKRLKGMESFNPIKHCLKMVKGGFGLKDAPRMWRLRLDAELKRCGLKACQADASIYCKHRWDQSSGTWTLVLILSTHVDDLKGGGEEHEVQALVKQLSAAFGEGKLEYSKFEHCGVRHVQGEDFSITTTMDHYIDQLKPIVSSELKIKSNEDSCSAALAALYGTLLGGLHWLAQGAARHCCLPHSSPAA